MKIEIDLLADYADAEFDGESCNGASLMGTLRALDAAQAAAESTFEGYSAWSVALHVAYCKWAVAKGMLDDADRAALAAELGPYPHPIGAGGFAAPLDSSAEAWEACLAYLARVHGVAMRVVREADDAEVEREFALWKMPMGKAIVWLCGHDSYHTAQIRSMGLPGLCGKRAF